MNKVKLANLLILIVTLLVLLSCATTTQTSLRASSMGFTKEIDEPSARGQLTRVSPEQSNVKYRFCLSPDKKFIVFSGTQSGGSDNLIQLWKISSDGSGSPIKITSGGSSNKLSPSYTNDGNYIVYASQGQLWKVRKDGAGGKMKIPGSGTNQDLVPNVSVNNIIVFCSTQKTPNNIRYLIWTSNLNGGELTQLREGVYPQWSPDGSKIVFEHKNEIWLIDADGTNLMQLTNTLNINESLPSFSPDGHKIVYVSNEDDNGKPMIDYNIWTMNSDGSGKRQETELSSWDSWPLWSEDGIYFLSARAQTQNENIQRIWKLLLK